MLGPSGVEPSKSPADIFSSAFGATMLTGLKVYSPDCSHVIADPRRRVFKT